MLRHIQWPPPIYRCQTLSEEEYQKVKPQFDEAWRKHDKFENCVLPLILYGSSIILMLSIGVTFLV